MNTEELWAELKRSIDSGELLEHVVDIFPPKDLYTDGQLYDWAREEGPLELFDISELVEEVVYRYTPQEVFGDDMFDAFLHDHRTLTKEGRWNHLKRSPAPTQRGWPSF
jgi:hypothetical protein